MFRRYLLLFAMLLCFYTMQAQEQTPARAIVWSAQNFIQSLTPEQQQAALFKFADPDRYNWSNEPENMHPRKGLKLSAMTDAQKILLHKLLQTSIVYF